MLSVEEKAAALARGVFDRLDDEARLALAERMGERELAHGQPLFIRGEPGTEMFIVVEGTIEIHRDERVIAALGPGELIGEMAVLGAGYRTACGRARGAVRLLIQQVPEIAFAIFAVLVERLGSTNDLAFFLAGARREYARVEVAAGDLAGQTFPLHHRSAVLGKAQGSLLTDAMRLALPSADPALAAQHARLSVEEGQLYIEPLAGLQIDGHPVEDTVQLTAAEEVAIGALRLRFRVTESE